MQRQTIEREREEGAAEVWRGGQLLASGYMHAEIARPVTIWEDGQRSVGIPDYQAMLEDLTPPLGEVNGVVVKACGRTIPCFISGGRLYPSGKITPAP